MRCSRQLMLVVSPIIISLLIGAANNSSQQDSDFDQDMSNDQNFEEKPSGQTSSKEENIGNTPQEANAVDEEVEKIDNAEANPPVSSNSATNSLQGTENSGQAANNGLNILNEPSTDPKNDVQPKLEQDLGDQNAGLEGQANPQENSASDSGVGTPTEESVPQAAPAPIIAPELPPPNEFAGAPPVPGSLKQIASGEGPEEYTVVNGDTLFDICDQLIDEPGYWPKLWSLNPQIKNPHFIYPGMILRFYPGDVENPPYLQVVDEGDMVPVDKSGLSESDLIHAELQGIAEKMAIEATPVIGMNDVVAGPADDLLEFGSVYSNDSIRVQVPGYIVAEKFEELGTVLGGLDGEDMSGPISEVMIENEKLAAGQTYSVLRLAGKIHEKKSNDFVGYRYDLVGSVKVDHMVDGGDIGVALPITMRLPFRPGDVVVPYQSSARIVPASINRPAIGRTEAHIVGTEYEGLTITGSGGFVFIDRGKSNGIAQGQFYEIYQQPGYLGDLGVIKNIPADKRKIGIIQIIDTTDVSAVGYVLYNSREVQIGDTLFNG